LVAAGCGGQEEQKPASAAASQAKRTVQRARRAHRIDRLEQQIAKARKRTRAARAAQGATTIPGFDAFARGLDGRAGAVIGSPDGKTVQSGGNLPTGAAWSTIKVPIAAQVIADAGGPDALSAQQRALIERAITESDNAAAADLWSELEDRHGGAQGAADAVTKLLREAGDTRTQVSTQGRDDFSPYGQTQWSLLDQHRFMTALSGRCVVSPAASAYVLDLMGRVTSDTWGLGSAGVPALWKGGWGPDPGGAYLVRQMGELKPGGDSVIVTVAAQASSGAFDAGQQMASAAARWLADHASAVAGSGSPC
jgi:hypothetical protein